MPFPGMAGFKSSEAVGNTMRKAWVNFARTGDPSIPEFDGQSTRTTSATIASIDEEFTLFQDPYRHQRSALGEVLDALTGKIETYDLHLQSKNQSKAFKLSYHIYIFRRSAQK